MVVIGLKIGEGLKFVDVDVDVVGLKILDHWFEFNFGSLGFKSQIVVGICFQIVDHCRYMFYGFQIADSC